MSLQDINEIKTDFKLSSKIANSYTAGFPVATGLTLVNKGPQISKKQTVTVESDGLLPVKQNITIDQLLPFERKEIIIHFKNTSFLTNKTYTITMSVAGKKYTGQVHIIPVYKEQWKIIGGIAGVIFTIFILIFTFKSRRIRIS